VSVILLEANISDVPTVFSYPEASWSLEVISSNPPMLPGSFLLHW